MCLSYRNDNNTIVCQSDVGSSVRLLHVCDIAMISSAAIQSICLSHCYRYMMLSLRDGRQCDDRKRQ